MLKKWLTICGRIFWLDIYIGDDFCAYHGWELIGRNHYKEVILSTDFVLVKDAEEPSEAALMAMHCGCVSHEGR